MSAIDYNPAPATESSWWYPCKNIGGSTIPPFGAVQLDAPDGYIVRDDRRVVLRVKPPTITGVNARTFFNGPQPIKPQDTGAVTDGRIVVAAFDDEDGTPVSGDVWGPIKDHCKLKRRVPGGRVLRAPENGETHVILLRYENYSVTGRLTETLKRGRSAEAKLCWFDKNASTNQLKIVEDGGDPEIRFIVFEATGYGGFEPLPESAIVFGRWDESISAYVLCGWVC